jgi:hypothetical protein
MKSCKLIASTLHLVLQHETKFAETAYDCTGGSNKLFSMNKITHFISPKNQSQSAHKTEIQNCDLITVMKCRVHQNNKHI